MNSFVFSVASVSRRLRGQGFDFYFLRLLCSSVLLTIKFVSSREEFSSASWFLSPLLVFSVSQCLRASVVDFGCGSAALCCKGFALNLGCNFLFVSVVAVLY